MIQSRVAVRPLCAEPPAVGSVNIMGAGGLTDLGSLDFGRFGRCVGPRADKQVGVLFHS